MDNWLFRVILRTQLSCLGLNNLPWETLPLD